MLACKMIIVQMSVAVLTFGQSVPGGVHSGANICACRNRCGDCVNCKVPKFSAIPRHSHT